MCRCIARSKTSLGEFLRCEFNFDELFKNCYQVEYIYSNDAFVSRISYVQAQEISSCFFGCSVYEHTLNFIGIIMPFSSNLQVKNLTLYCFSYNSSFKLSPTYYLIFHTTLYAPINTGIATEIPDGDESLRVPSPFMLTFTWGPRVPLQSPYPCSLPYLLAISVFQVADQFLLLLLR